ncbi:glycogen synthase [Marichromatium bheemlicum]|uniref:Glycogen synthase n=1 Tax=Marichromatium bheemlicum TaxID=365339 RepID=A0ABX1I9C9_9GAMM|nr:glycogen synthase [Marichromatium bheemlicum]NKN33416.1 glycogen synthase [Marichromatium bheemlicum]
MRVVMVAAECAPIAKVGGLGDFIHGLSRALVAAGATVQVLLPYYRGLLSERWVSLLEPLDEGVSIPFDGGTLACACWRLRVEGLECILIDPAGDWFRRARLYGEPDDGLRFALFARAADALLRRPGWRPDIIHCHDWQSALLPVLRSAPGADIDAPARVCITLHNLAHQGVIEPALLTRLGVDVEALLAPGPFDDPGAPGRANLLRGAIDRADFVNTVSPRYAWEVLHTEQGMGLQGLLQAHADKFGGILNGIDDAVWDPAQDPLIPTHYGTDTLALKAHDRLALRRRLGLCARTAPILALIGRLDAQKGVELILSGIDSALALGYQVVLLGSAPDPVVATRFAAKRAALADCPDAHLELGFDEGLAHLIYAGADMILVPSRYEPCGLTQLIAMRYGTVPLVRRVGGLADTVIDANHSDHPVAERNGYLFEAPTCTAVHAVLARAAWLWHHHPHHFHRLRVNGMSADHSWRRPAARYLALYRGLLGG